MLFYLHVRVAGVTSNFVIIKASKNPTEQKKKLTSVGSMFSLRSGEQNWQQYWS